MSKAHTLTREKSAAARRPLPSTGDVARREHAKNHAGLNKVQERVRASKQNAQRRNANGDVNGQWIPIEEYVRPPVSDDEMEQVIMDVFDTPSRDFARWFLSLWDDQSRRTELAAKSRSGELWAKLRADTLMAKRRSGAKR